MIGAALLTVFFSAAHSLLAQSLPSSLNSLTPLKGEGVECSLQDAEGFWWYGGKGTGLCRFDGYETETFRSDRQHPDLLRSNDLLCIIEQKANAEIWFGTKEGAYILSKRDYTLRPLRIVPSVGGGQEDAHELADKRISCMMTAADGSVWLTYRNQLLHFSPQAKLIERFETTWEGKNRSILSMCFDADSTLWAGLWNGGVISMKKVHGQWLMVKGQWSDYPNDQTTHLPNDQTTKLMLDSVMRKLALANDTTVLSWVNIGTREKAFYIGTYHSLYFYNGQQLTGLHTNLDKVRSMAYSEKSQTLYLLSKARGICQWKGGKLTTLLNNTEFRQLQLQADTALLLSRGVEGVSLLNLRNLKLTTDTTTTDVRPIVTAYSVDGEKRLIPFGAQTLILPKDAELVEIYLSTLDFDHASQVQFAYRLNENGEWMELSEGEHVVKFAHLPAGTHQLQVRATDNFGRWSIPVTVMTLVRPAVWYEHVWLWVLLVATLLIGLMGLKRIMGSKGPMKSLSPSLSFSATLGKHPFGLSGEGRGGVSPLPSLPVADQEFLDKAAAAVSAHMIDSDYSVDALAGDLCMSRANLHRKMRAITGQTPTDFIRNQRLERAAELLRTTSHSVNEIADLVGFSYASYFTKCFKEKYGVLPKDY